MPYKRLTREQRHTIDCDLAEGKNYSDIARRLNVNRSTISREVKRNREAEENYSYYRADEMSQRRAFKTWRKTQNWQEIEEALREDLSPEQVRGSLLKVGKISPSIQTMYGYIQGDRQQGGDLYKHLRRHKKPYRKRGEAKDKRGQIKHRKPIEERPEIVDDKTRLGDWEADTVIGRVGGKALVTLTERFSRYTLMALVPNKEAAEVAAKITDLFKAKKSKVHTVTYDNGKEFAFHYLVNEIIGCESYFANPYHSWERGLNENTNGLIRQYLPKQMSFDEVTESEILTIQNKLNSRPRKCLDYSTPNDIFLAS